MIGHAMVMIGHVVEMAQTAVVAAHVRRRFVEVVEGARFDEVHFFKKDNIKLEKRRKEMSNREVFLLFSLLIWHSAATILMLFINDLFANSNNS